MTREEAKQLLPIIQAYSKGKEIEGLYKGTKSPWFKIKDMDLNCGIIFRIKPKYRPFKDAEECWQEMLKHQPFGYTYDRFNNIRDCITKVATTGVSYDSPTVVISFEEVFNRFVFADGVPFGVKVEE